MATPLFVTCECGKQIPVTAGMAGSEVECECGKKNSVPTLRSLTRERGPVSEADHADPLVAIRSCLEHGQPPAGTTCLVCQIATENTIICRLDGWQSGWEDPSSLWITRWWRRLRARPQPANAQTGAPADKPKGAIGDGKAIAVPVRICAACFRRAGDLEQPHILRRILDRSALYRQVFSTYPRAQMRYQK